MVSTFMPDMISGSDEGRKLDFIFMSASAGGVRCTQDDDVTDQIRALAAEYSVPICDSPWLVQVGKRFTDLGVISCAGQASKLLNLASSLSSV